MGCGEDGRLSGGVSRKALSCRRRGQGSRSRGGCMCGCLRSGRGCGCGGDVGVDGTSFVIDNIMDLTVRTTRIECRVAGQPSV